MLYVRGLIKKITVIFKLHELRMFDFRMWCCVMLVYMSAIYAENISHFVLSVYFWQIKRLVVFWCAFRFEILIVAFGESTTNRTQLLLWYNRFKEGREDVNDDARPGRPSTMKTLKQWRKWFWIIVETLLEIFKF